MFCLSGVTRPPELLRQWLQTHTSTVNIANEVDFLSAGWQHKQLGVSLLLSSHRESNWSFLTNGDMFICWQTVRICRQITHVRRRQMFSLKSIQKTDKQSLNSLSSLRRAGRWTGRLWWLLFFCGDRINFKLVYAVPKINLNTKGGAEDKAIIYRGPSGRSLWR